MHYSKIGQEMKPERSNIMRRGITIVKYNIIVADNYIKPQANNDKWANSEIQEESW